MGAGLAVFFLFQLLSRVPGLVEATYGSLIGPFLAVGLSRISSLVPVSLLELLVVAFLLRQAVGLAAGAVQVGRRRRSVRNGLAAGGLRLGADLGILVVLFYLLWGFHYARPALDDRLDLPAAADGRVEEVTFLAREMVTATNRTYYQIHGSRDAGEPTRTPRHPRELEEALDLGWTAVVDELPLPSVYGSARGSAKPFLFDRFVKRLGVSGAYSPFTGEALVLPDLPAVAYGKVVAHETAHQRGLPVEAEANFMGFMAATRSPDPLLRYGAYAFAQRQLMSVLVTENPEAWRELRSLRLPGVQRDLDALRRYWNPTRNPFGDLGTRVNDMVLRTHGVESGILSYDESLGLLVAFARGSGWSLVAPSFRADVAPVGAGPVEQGPAAGSRTLED